MWSAGDISIGKFASENSSQNNLSTLRFFFADVSTYVQQGSDVTSVSTVELGTQRLQGKYKVLTSVLHMQ